MLDNKGFDLWAEGYDASVGLSDAEGRYPFAGYKQVLGEIYRRILRAEAKTVLDIGFGTAVLTAKLYEQGCAVWGQDFSEKMIALAKEKMPEAGLYRGDFSQGLAEPLKQNRYDAIIATYSLHHLTDGQKTDFIKSLLPLLRSGGCVYIGDIAFDSQADLEENKVRIGDEWDEEEHYFIVENIRAAFPTMQFQRFSFCAGLFTIVK